MSGAWLILETSGRVGKVGLARGAAVVRAVSLDDTRRHARDLAATVGELLKAESLAPAELTGVVVGRGPGSYTGLRVGLMSAKALAYATGCELIAVDTFAAIARQAPAGTQNVSVIADALQGQVYAQAFALRHDGWAAADSLRIEPVGAWASQLPEGVAVSGPGVKVYADRIPPHARVVTEADREPRVESVFAAAATLAPVTREGLFSLEPLYLRGSSAEEKARGGSPAG